MNIPTALKYAMTDEWVLIEGEIATIGITDYAQDSLSDIVFFESIVSVGDSINLQDHIATVESVKAAADINAPLAGKVIAINDDLSNSPETINADPFGRGWMMKLELTSQPNLDHLMDADGYEKYLADRSH
jgi:glycine cleavage system H protein